MKTAIFVLLLALGGCAHVAPPEARFLHPDTPGGARDETYVWNEPRVIDGTYRPSMFAAARVACHRRHDRCYNCRHGR